MAASSDPPAATPAPNGTPAIDDTKTAPPAATVTESPATEPTTTTVTEPTKELAAEPATEPVTAAATDVKEEEKLEQPPATAAAESTKSPTTPTTQDAENTTRATSVDVDQTRPADFDGEVKTNNDLPTLKTIQKLENYIILDRDGKTHPFKSLYSGRNVARRVLVIFVRHFFCGNCQEFLRSLSESITTEALLRLPISTFITVIGHGDPALIDMYVQETGCPFPVYTDPTRRLFDALGMVSTLAMGEKPAYMKKSMFKSAAASVLQGLKQMKTGLVMKAGNQKQVGGEFLFEPVNLTTPVTTPQGEVERGIGDTFNGNKESKEDDDEFSGVEEKRVTWCHRMRTTRDHAEIPELMEVLGLDGQGKPIEDSKLWSKALETRKGTGLSMASQMSMLSGNASP